MAGEKLSEKQIKELNRLTKLPPEEQRIQLNDFLQTLSPEQAEFLKKHQGKECVFCAIVEGKISAYKIYEDEFIIAVLDINPANKGHIILFPKFHHEILSLMKDVGHLFNAANYISSAIFDVTHADGTNIFVANGVAAGQNVPHTVVHIIPRFKDDKVKFSWEKTEVSQEDMNTLLQSLRVKLRPPQKTTEKIDMETILQDRAYSSRVP